MTYFNLTEIKRFTILLQIILWKIDAKFRLLSLILAEALYGFPILL